MAQNNATPNDNTGAGKKDPTTHTAYGDPVKDSSPTNNNDYKKATSSIAESTQNGNARGSKMNAKEYEDPITHTAYGDPLDETYNG